MNGYVLNVHIRFQFNTTNRVCTQAIVDQCCSAFAEKQERVAYTTDRIIGRSFIHVLSVTRYTEYTVNDINMSKVLGLIE